MFNVSVFLFGISDLNILVCICRTGPLQVCCATIIIILWSLFTRDAPNFFSSIICIALVYLFWTKPLFQRKNKHSAMVLHYSRIVQNWFVVSQVSSGGWGCSAFFPFLKLFCNPLHWFLCLWVIGRVPWIVMILFVCFSL